MVEALLPPQALSRNAINPRANKIDKALINLLFQFEISSRSSWYMLGAKPG